jgi:hypothetical protein
MNQKYYILSEYVNLNGISTNSKEIYQSYITGDDTSRKQLIPNYMFERGQVVDIDLSQLDDNALTSLCSKEGCLAIVRVDTEYNEEARKQGFDADMYKILVGNESKYTNTVMSVSVISQFCTKWEEKKAFVLNSQYSRYYLPLIDKFYLDIISKNKVQNKVVK